MAMRMYINGREVTSPAAKRLAAPFVALIVLGMIGLLLLLLVPILGIAIGGLIGLAGAGGIMLLARAIRGGRRIPRRTTEEFASYRIIEDDEERKRLEE
jgi:hypothetical protein